MVCCSDFKTGRVGWILKNPIRYKMSEGSKLLEKRGIPKIAVNFNRIQLHFRIFKKLSSIHSYLMKIVWDVGWLCPHLVVCTRPLGWVADSIIHIVHNDTDLNPQELTSQEIFLILPLANSVGILGCNCLDKWSKKYSNSMRIASVMYIEILPCGPLNTFATVTGMYTKSVEILESIGAWKLSGITDETEIYDEAPIF